ncbi:MAG: pyridoxal phosphate-dependent aminotransferase family protein [Clostridia bacterium]|nr:pyridoxal phosphate-dependent aminotransferase family protein [Clostridia bacterium]
MDIFKKCEDRERLEMLMERDIYPYFHTLTSKQAPEVKMGGKDVIMIGSNNYLGLTSNPEVIEAGVKALEKYGSGCSGSRFLNGTLDLHLELESRISSFLKKEDAVTFSTGFQSNLGIIAGITGRNDVILCDRENHASIYDACRLSFGRMLRYNHADMTDLEEKLKTVDTSVSGILIVTDGVFSMGGDIAKLPEIVALAKKYGARVMVDDAHGLGVLGEHGRGTAEYYGLENDVDIYMGTFSKSLASIGGYMAASKKVCDYIRHTSRPFIFSASITPPNAACALKALEILEREPQRVKRLAEISDYMRTNLKREGVDIIDGVTPIIPIYTYTDMRTFTACKLLFDRGVYVNSVVSPATPVGKSLLRTSYMATHTEEQMDRALVHIKAVLEEVKSVED